MTEDLSITLSFRLNVNLSRDDTITLALPGFSRASPEALPDGRQIGAKGFASIALAQPGLRLFADDSIAHRTNYAHQNASAFNASWDEAQQALRLRVTAAHVTSRALVSVTVNASNGLRLPAERSLARDGANLTLAASFAPGRADGARAIPATAVARSPCVGVCASAVRFLTAKAGFPSPIETSFEISCGLAAGDRVSLRLPAGLRAAAPRLGGGDPHALHALPDSTVRSLDGAERGQLHRVLERQRVGLGGPAIELIAQGVLPLAGSGAYTSAAKTSAFALTIPREAHPHAARGPERRADPRGPRARQPQRVARGLRRDAPRAGRERQRDRHRRLLVGRLRAAARGRGRRARAQLGDGDGAQRARLGLVHAARLLARRGRRAVLPAAQPAGRRGRVGRELARGDVGAHAHRARLEPPATVLAGLRAERDARPRGGRAAARVRARGERHAPARLGARGRGDAVSVSVDVSPPVGVLRRGSSLALAPGKAEPRATSCSRSSSAPTSRRARSSRSRCRPAPSTRPRTRARASARGARSTSSTAGRTSSPARTRRPDDDFVAPLRGVSYTGDDDYDARFGAGGGGGGGAPRRRGGARRRRGRGRRRGADAAALADALTAWEDERARAPRPRALADWEGAFQGKWRKSAADAAWSYEYYYLVRRHGRADARAELLGVLGRVDVTLAGLACADVARARARARRRGSRRRSTRAARRST